MKWLKAFGGKGHVADPTAEHASVPICERMLPSESLTWCSTAEGKRASSSEETKEASGNWSGPETQTTHICQPLTFTLAISFFHNLLGLLLFVMSFKATWNCSWSVDYEEEESFLTSLCTVWTISLSCRYIFREHFLVLVKGDVLF